MNEAPHAPWALRGEVVAAVVRGGAGTGMGVRLLYGARYTESPVGPFVELGVAVPSRVGLRPGLRSVLVVVSSAPAKVGFRSNWGIPAELGRLSWSVDGDERVVRWDERGVVLRAVPVGPRLPAFLPTRGIEQRGNGPVLVPRRVGGVLRFGRCAVSVASDDDGLAGLAGAHRGVVLSAARVVMRPARHPMGVLSSFRAPLREIEPGLSYRVPAWRRAPLVLEDESRRITRISSSRTSPSGPSRATEALQ